MQFGGKIAKYFLKWPLLRNKNRQQNYVKNKDNYGNWFEDQIDILQFFSDEFNRRFKKDP